QPRTQEDTLFPYTTLFRSRIGRCEEKGSAWPRSFLEGKIVKLRRDGRTMKLVSVNVGLPREVTWHGRIVTTGIFKEPVKDRVARSEEHTSELQSLRHLVCR